MDDVRLSFILRRYRHLNFCSALAVFMSASVILAGRRSIVVLSGVKNPKKQTDSRSIHTKYSVLTHKGRMLSQKETKFSENYGLSEFHLLSEVKSFNFDIQPACDMDTHVRLVCSKSSLYFVQSNFSRLKNCLPLLYLNNVNQLFFSQSRKVRYRFQIIHITR